MIIQYPLYSKDWHGISVTDVASELGVPLDGLATTDVYKAIYDRWRTSGFKSNPDWVDAKQKIADILRKQLLPPEDAPTILSLGAGLGIVESHLMDDGYQIELQACQSAGFDWIYERHDVKTWVTEGFGDLPSRGYDVLLALSLTYAFDLVFLRSFLKDCERILKPEGLFILWDHDAKFSTNVVRRKGLKWGWLRTPTTYRTLLSQAGFEVQQTMYFGRDCEERSEQFRVLGIQMPWGDSLAQMHVARVRSAT